MVTLGSNKLLLVLIEDEIDILIIVVVLELCQKHCVKRLSFLLVSRLKQIEWMS